MIEPQKVFNIYCDESRVENTDSAKMVIGALLIPRPEKKKIVEDIKNIRSKHNFSWELKWTKTNANFINFYKELLDYFVSDSRIYYRCIIVDKTKVDYLKYHNDDEELAFFKFYYFMLKQKLIDYQTYYIFIDKKPTRDKNRARALHAFLESYILLHKQKCSIMHLQTYHSCENILLQFADYLTGLVAYAANVSKKISPKFLIAEYLKNRLCIKTFLRTSPLGEQKFNTFLWQGINEKKS